MRSISAACILMAIAMAPADARSSLETAAFVLFPNDVPSEAGSNQRTILLKNTEFPKSKKREFSERSPCVYVLSEDVEGSFSDNRERTIETEFDIRQVQDIYKEGEGSYKLGGTLWMCRRTIVKGEPSDDRLCHASQWFRLTENERSWRTEADVLLGMCPQPFVPRHQHGPKPFPFF